MPSYLAGKRARCPRCKTVFSTADLPADGNESDAITAAPGVSPGHALPGSDVFLEPEEKWPDIGLEMRCDHCSKTLRFPPWTVGTVQECPECGEYLDVPEIGRPPTTAEIEEAAAERTEHEWELRSRERTRQQAVVARQIEQAQRALDRRDQQDDRYDKLLDRLEGVIAQWARLAGQAERVLEQMGRQGPA
jgi:hypothetical protein